MNIAVFIGRFQPFHNGHMHILTKGLEDFDRVIVLVGSAYQPRSVRNPFTYDERKDMILQSVFDEHDVRDADRVIVEPLRDISYNDEKWIRQVQMRVNRHVNFGDEITVIGHSKDSTSYYLKIFPQWKAVEIDNVDGINSTDIRKSYFYDNIVDDRVLPFPVSNFLFHEVASEVFKYLVEEYKYIENYKRAWENAPYPPTFVCTDAVVVQSGHILLVERKAMPGAGSLALPGGFVNQEETLLDGCIRELREETRLKVPEPVLRGSVVRSKVYDDPNRSARGRTITNAFYIELKPSHELPPVKGGDDARKAFWVPLGDLDSSKFFEDHYHIIQDIIG